MSKNKNNDVKKECKCECKNFNSFEHLWKYFELHANQRITLFRFYTAFFSLFVGATGFLLIRFSYSGVFAEISAIFLSIVFTMITIVFHLLDCRNRQLIHYSENGLKLLESYCVLNDCDPCKEIRVFTKERGDPDSRTHHTTCFRIMYITAYIITGLLFVGSLLYLCACGIFSCSS